MAREGSDGELYLGEERKIPPAEASYFLSVIMFGRPDE